MKLIRFSTVCVTLAIFAAFTSSFASAGPRYGNPPPVILSQDLFQPWIMQLQTHPLPSQPHGHDVVTGHGYKLGIARTSAYSRRVYVPAGRHRTNPQYRVRQRNQQIYQPQTRIRPAYNQQPVVRHASLNKKSQPARTQSQLDSIYIPQIVAYETSKRPGEIVIDTNQKFLYLVMGNGQARRYGVGVGKPGFEWSGVHKISRKAEWPDWRPPSQMIEREKKKGRIIPTFVAGGPKNPLGARAMYLGSSLYRIHGTNRPSTIGKAVSSGCIRMRNEDVMDLYERVGVGTRVTVI